MRHSLILLAVCLPNCSFSYTYAGFPGSANDARVFRCSDLGVAIYEEKTLLFPDSQYHVLADSAFPCTPHVMPSIKASLAANKKKKNTTQYYLKLAFSSNMHSVTSKTHFGVCITFMLTWKRP
jgi:hypothetical protein